MSDVATSGRTTDLHHEPAVPGWRPRPPGAVLRASRLERHRRRQLARLAETRPEWHARITGLQQSSRRFWDAVMPRERILSVTVAVLALTVFDAVATMALVGSGVAEEANPLLSDLIDRLGLGAAMAVRVAFGGALTLLLAWLSTWRREARPVLAFVALLLWAVAGLHVVGIASSFG